MSHDDATPVQKLTVDVKARIAARCGFRGDQDDHTGAQDLTVAHTLVIPFQLDCNTPFVIGVKSQHGAFAADRTPDGSGFAFTKAYRLSLDIGTNGQALTPAACDSTALTAPGAPGAACAFYGAKPGQGLSSGKLISIDRPSSMSLSWDGQGAGPRNVAGRYSDTITITVSART
ncbi:MAG TPA: hypothetical protein VKU90_14190 [Caulobacteraceae bacterium]|nr:hypothetical protein [Caulobacteraceae bacterium]